VSSLTVCTLCSTSVDAEADLAWIKDGFAVLRCPVCRLVFRANLPDRATIERLYDEGYFRDRTEASNRQGYSHYLADESLHRRNARRRLRRLSAQTGAPGRVLDVGCAAGFFVDEARAAGWDATGIDVSAVMVDWARANLGARVAKGGLGDVDPTQAPFDLVTMWDYIEHSADPRGDLACVRRVIAEDGVLALSTGDIGSATAKVSGRRWHLLTPEHHNFFFSTSTLRRLLEVTGFRVVEITRRGALYSLAHVLYKLETVIPATRMRRMAATIRTGPAADVAFPLNLFDIVTVVARPVPSTSRPV
jgi:SAM-dependent methyltransferase